MTSKAKLSLFDGIYALLPEFEHRTHLREELKNVIKDGHTYFKTIPNDICMIILDFVPTPLRKHPDNLREIMQANYQEFIQKYKHKTKTNRRDYDRIILNNQLLYDFPEKFELPDFKRLYGNGEWFIKYDGQLTTAYYMCSYKYAGQNYNLTQNEGSDYSYLEHNGDPQYRIRIGEFADIIAILPCGLIIIKTNLRDNIKLFIINPRDPVIDPNREKYNSSNKESVPTRRLEQKFVEYIRPYLDKQFLIDDFGNITTFSDTDPEAFRLSTYSTRYLVGKPRLTYCC